MLQALNQLPDNDFSSSACAVLELKNSTLEDSKLVLKRIEMVDIPDEIIENILEFYAMNPKHKASEIRLVNKRLGALALSCTMQTISVSSEGLVKLFSAGHSPVYNEYLGKHVRCFELALTSRIPKLVDIGDRVSSAFPNLNVVRFKFAMGVFIHTGESLQALLTEDTLFRSFRETRSSSLYRFLAQLRPQRFEWVSSERHDIYLVGVYPKLRHLFHSWSTLSTIYLEGICLVEQSSLATWNIALFADRVHIKGAFSSTEPIFLEGLRRMKDSKRCRLLLLEESWSTDQCSQEMTTKQVAALTYGNTLVSLKHWSALNRRRLKACATGRTLPPCVFRSFTNKVSRIGQPAPSPARSTVEFVLLVSLCAILCILHAIGPHHSLMGRMHLSLFDIFGGPYEFKIGSIYWIICGDGSYLGERYCSSDSSLWLPDRSLMFHPT